MNYFLVKTLEQVPFLSIECEGTNLSPVKGTRLNSLEFILENEGTITSIVGFDSSIKKISKAEATTLTDIAEKAGA